MEQDAARRKLGGDGATLCGGEVFVGEGAVCLGRHGLVQEKSKP